jgi:hypothetical protein
MSRWEGTRMASDRAVTTGATTTAAAHGSASSTPTRDTTQASGGKGLTRVALYACVSTDNQAREETVARQVDLRHQRAEAHGYEGGRERNTQYPSPVSITYGFIVIVQGIVR